MSKSKTTSETLKQEVKLSPKAHIVDRFTAPLEDRHLILDKIRNTHNVLSTFPGFSQNFVFEQISDDKEYNVIAITEWENQELLDKALNEIMQFPEDIVFIKTSGNEFEIEKHEHNYSQIQFKPDKITKNTLLDQIETIHSDFMSFVEALSEEALTREIKDDWSIKDYMMHLAMWQRTVTYLLNQQPRYRAMDIPKKIWETQNNDEINEALKNKYSEMSISDVFELFEKSHTEFKQKVNKLTIEDLILPYNYYEKSSDSTNPVISLVTGIGIYHISSHLENLSELVKQKN